MELKADELLLAQTRDGLTAFQIAAEKNRVETRMKMWVWAEETQFNPKDLKNKFFLAKDINGYIAWHRAEKFGSLEAIETLWSWVKELKLETHEDLLHGIFFK